MIISYGKNRFLHKILNNQHLILPLLCVAFLPLIVGEKTVFMSLAANTFTIATDYYYYFKFCFLCVIGASMILVLLLAYFRRTTITVSKLYLFFLLLAYFSALFSQNKHNAFFGIAGRYQGFYTYLFYFAIIAYCATFLTAKHIKIIIGFLLASAVVIAVLSLLQYYGIELFPNSLGVRIYGRYFVRGTIGNRNFVGSYFSMLMPIAAVLYIKSKNKRASLLYYLLAGLLFCGLIVSLTRVAWVGSIAAIVVIAIFQFKLIEKNIKRIISLLLLFIILFTFISFTDGGRVAGRNENFKEQVVSFDEATFGTGRLLIYQYTMQVVEHYPLLGTGPDCVGTVLNKLMPDSVRESLGGKNTYIDKVHSEYLEIAATMGIPAAVCFLLYFIILLAPLLIKFKRLSTILQAVFCGVVAYLAQATFNIGVISVLPVFYVLIGILFKYGILFDKLKIRHKARDSYSADNKVIITK